MTPRRLVSILCAVGGCLLLAVPMFAVGGTVQKNIVRVTVDPSAITVEPETELDNGRIRLLNPEGLEIVRDLKGGFGQVTIDDLAREVEGLSLDGCWTYEIVGTPSLTATEQDLLEQSRETGRPVPLALQQKLQNSNQSGAFMVEEGRFFLDETIGETDIDGKLRAEAPNQFDSALGISAEVPTGLDRQVISGDLVVYNSICVGFDCPTNPSFGADTIRLQENNLRIHFDDTSTAASFPNRDWRIVANDQANGGANKFTVQDATANRNVFTIEGNAPSNSLYVDDGGRVGLGTSTPVLEIHAVDGDTPALRLEQDGSSGFAPQTWDLAGNETSFFIRDATNGSTLPFRIFPSAPSNSLVVDTDGDVAIGRTSAEERLHLTDTGDTDGAKIFFQSGTTSTVGHRFGVRSDAANTDLQAEALRNFTVIIDDDNDDSNANFLISINGNPNDDIFRAREDKRIRMNGASPTATSHPLVVGTNATDGNGAHLTAAGVWTNGSSRVNKTNIVMLDAAAAMEALENLQPVRYRGKQQPDEEYVGFIAEDVPDLVAMNDRKGIASMDVVGVLTKVLQEHQKIVKEQQQTIQILNQRLEKLEQGAGATQNP